MHNILLLNGPNLNLLGTREVARYGRSSLPELVDQLTEVARSLQLNLRSLQTNIEGELVNAVQQAKQEQTDAILINPGAYAHTSIALRDALLAVEIPFIEVHISNVYARESYRKHSYLADIANGVIVGCGPFGYELGLRALAQQLNILAK